MSYTEWKEVGVPQNPNFKCYKCGTREGLQHRQWDSSDGAFTDDNYRCTKCGNNWWVDGPDS